MDRRSFLLAASGALFISPIKAPAAELAPHAGWRRFQVVTTVNLAEQAEPAQLWLPLAQNAPGRQRNLSVKVETNGALSYQEDARYGAAVAKVEWIEPGARSATLIQLVDTCPAVLTPATLDGSERAFWLAATPSAPTDGLVAETARRIVGERREPEDKARAIYDWVVDNTFREGSVRGCGTGDIRRMLETGRLGGKCADINTLMTALARSAGLPARDIYGLRVAPSQESPSLGATDDVTKAQHCRSEIFIDGKGWLPVDPADVRKVVLEEKAPLDSDHVKAQRARLFGSWEMNWIGFNSATDIVLPRAMRPMAANFLMYPCAMTAKDETDCLDPGNFRYRITSRELSV